MNTEVATTGQATRPQPIGNDNDDVSRCVEAQEKLERLVPKAIYLVVIGPLSVLALLQQRGVVSVILQGILLFFVAKLIAWPVRSLFLEPTRRIRYDRATDKLRSRLQGGGIAVGPFSWTLGAPGAMAMTRSGEVIILDRGHNYRPLRLLPHQIADVRVECNSQQFTQTLHSGRTTVGGFGKSFGLGYTMGGSSTSVTRTVNEFFLEIRYQLEKNGRVATVVVPGGPERRVVEELCATIRRLEA